MSEPNHLPSPAANEASTLLFDGYYLADPVLRYLQKRRWHWVTRLKTNRVLYVGGRKLKPANWEAEAAAGLVPPLSKSLVGHLPGWGNVRVVGLQRSATGGARHQVRRSRWSA